MTLNHHKVCQLDFVQIIDFEELNLIKQILVEWDYEKIEMITKEQKRLVYENFDIIFQETLNS